jgi:hypothetical protein
MTTGSAGKNPFKDPLAGRYGDGKDMVGLMASLTDDEMFDYIRNLNWSRERQKDNYNPWWIGKEVCAGERELDRRGLDPYSWRNPRTPEKYCNDSNTIRA